MASVPFSAEEMAAAVEDALRRTPGLLDRDVAAFMGRWVCCSFDSLCSPGCREGSELLLGGLLDRDVAAFRGRWAID